MKFRDSRTALLAVRNYLLAVVVPCISLVWGVCFLSTGNEMGFCLLHYYGILPLNAFLSGLLMARCRTRYIWAHPVLMGVVAALLPYSVFGTLTPAWALVGALPSALGIGLGVLMQRSRQRSGA